AVHPERRTVDIAFADTGLPVGAPTTDAGAGGYAPGRRLIACVDFVYGRPIVVGFVLLDGSQMGLTDQNREVHLHPSGACTMIAPDGSIETFHPGGGYVRIGTGDHQDLATVAAGGTWNTPAAPAPQITVATSGFKAIIAPGGQVTMTSNAGADVTF